MTGTTDEQIDIIWLMISITRPRLVLMTLHQCCWSCFTVEQAYLMVFIDSETHCIQQLIHLISILIFMQTTHSLLICESYFHPSTGLTYVYWNYLQFVFICSFLTLPHPTHLRRSEAYVVLCLWGMLNS